MLSAHLWACKLRKYRQDSKSWEVRPMLYGERSCLLELNLLFPALVVSWVNKPGSVHRGIAGLGGLSRWHVVLFQILPLCREHDATEVT
jgi:hypothetical protein